jgi:hypothetical protein
MRCIVHVRLAGVLGLGIALSIAVLLIQLPATAQTLPIVTVTGVTSNNSSARIFYNQVPGAKDYRVYDVANPNDVKYAGLVHYEPQSGKTPLDQVATDIEWNGLPDTAGHTLVVEAVDALGPVPEANLYNTPSPNGAHVPLVAGGMLGSNKGPTSDGKTSTNGQGPYTDQPNVIARSQPFVVHADQSITPLGKIAGATQPFLDTFDQSEAATLQHTVHNPCGTDAVGDVGVDDYVLNGGTSKESTVEMRLHDGDNSMPFISSSHFMDMLFSGGTSSCGGGTDITYGSLAFSPKQTATILSGSILHLTMEVDNHSDFNRWMAFNVSPATDPIQSWEPDLHVANNHAQALYVDLLGERLDVRVFNGSTTPVFSQSPAVLGQLYIPNDYMQSGRGFDDRSRLDLFVSQTHLAVFVDNTLVSQTDIPASAMAWFDGAVKTYFTHYMYHSDNNVDFLRNGEISGFTFCYPMNAYEFNDPIHGLSGSQNRCGIAYPPGYGFPHSDERHWDNMGFEVVPASATSATDFSSFGAAVKLGDPQAPHFTNGPPPPTATLPASTATPQPTATPAPNTPAPTNTVMSNTPIPTNTVVPPTATSTSTVAPSATPTSTATAIACSVLAMVNGQQQSFTRPASFCTDQ